MVFYERLSAYIRGCQRVRCGGSLPVCPVAAVCQSVGCVQSVQVCTVAAVCQSGTVYQSVRWWQSASLTVCGWWQSFSQCVGGGSVSVSVWVVAVFQSVCQSVGGVGVPVFCVSADCGQLPPWPIVSDLTPIDSYKRADSSGIWLRGDPQKG